MIEAFAAILILLAPQDLAEVKRQLASDDPAEQKKGYRALADLSSADRDKALKFLAELNEKFRKGYDKEVEGLTSLIDFKKIRKKLSDWEKKRSKAVSSIFNKSAFPNPKKGETVRGPFKGYSKVKAAMQSLDAAYASLTKPVDAVLAKKPAETWDGFEKRADRIDEIADVLRRHRTPAPPLKRFADPFWNAVALFDAGKLDEGVKIYETPLTATQKKLLFFFYCHGFMKVDGAAESEMGDKSKTGVRDINVLRMKLGILPLEGDDRLTKAMKLHLEDMAKNNYFGHYEPNEETKTPLQRCRKQGYEGMTGENISSAGPDRAAEMWMWDGGHFRNMVNPGFVQIGYASGERGSGFDAGTGDGLHLPRIQLFWKLPGK